MLFFLFIYIELIHQVIFFFLETTSLHPQSLLPVVCQVRSALLSLMLTVSRRCKPSVMQPHPLQTVRWSFVSSSMTLEYSALMSLWLMMSVLPWQVQESVCQWVSKRKNNNQKLKWANLQSFFFSFLLITCFIFSLRWVTSWNCCYGARCYGSRLCRLLYWFDVQVNLGNILTVNNSLHVTQES